MHHELKQEAIRLRVEEELSYDAIRKKLGVAKSTLHEWLKHFPLSRERILELKRANWTNNQAKIELYRTTMAEKRERSKQKIYDRYKKRFKKLSENSFFVAGLMLYLAEGAKTREYDIRIANTDVRIIKFFMRWLQKSFAISQGRLRAQLHLYPTMDIPKEILFWKKELEFEDCQFYKPEIRKLTKASFSYSESFRHGTCSLGFSSVEKKAEIMMAIRAFLDLHLSS
jgi:transposase-like protein